MLRFYAILLCIFVPAVFTLSAEMLTYDDATKWCDNTPMHPIEGIWTLPDDNITVLVARDGKSGEPTRMAYDLTVISGDNAALMSGTVIGHIEQTPDPSVFKLTISTGLSDGLPGKHRTLVARFSSDGEALLVEGPKLKFEFQPWTLLPRLWHILKVYWKNPVNELPRGMVRIYPGYDGNGSLHRYPRYL